MRPLARFTLKESVLAAHGELGMNDEVEFDRLLRRLLGSGGEELHLDLGGVTYMSSVFIGHIVVTLGVATQAGSTLVVHASAEVYRLLKLVGVENLGRIRLLADKDA